VSLRALAPESARGILRRIDHLMERRADRWDLFALVVLRREQPQADTEGWRAGDNR
jgi:hypothetical protein